MLSITLATEIGMFWLCKRRIESICDSVRPRFDLAAFKTVDAGAGAGKACTGDAVDAVVGATLGEGSWSEVGADTSRVWVEVTWSMLGVGTGTGDSLEVCSNALVLAGMMPADDIASYGKVGGGGNGRSTWNRGAVVGV